MSAEILGLASPALAARLQALTQQAVDAWALRWGVGPVRCEATVEAWPAASAPGQWLIEQQAGRAAQLFVPRAIEREIVQRLYGADAARQQGVASGSMAAVSVQQVSDDLQRTLSQAWSAAGWSPCPVAPDALSRWDAPVHLRLSVGEAAVLAVVPGVRFLAKRSQPGTRTADPLPAFGTLRTRATLVLGEAELSMADIAGLQPGDVLMLNAALSDTAQLHIEGSSAVLHGYLGRQGDLRAVQFTHSSKS